MVSVRQNRAATAVLVLLLSGTSLSSISLYFGDLEELRRSSIDFRFLLESEFLVTLISLENRLPNLDLVENIPYRRSPLSRVWEHLDRRYGLRRFYSIRNVISVLVRLTVFFHVYVSFPPGYKPLKDMFKKQCRFLAGYTYVV